MLSRTLFTTLALLAPSVSAAADSTWAVFDSKRAMEATTHFKAAKAALDKEVEARETTFEAKKAELKAKEEELEGLRAMAAPEALAEQERSLIRKRQQLAQLFYRSQQELARFDRKLKQQLFVRLEAAVREVATEGDHLFVIDASKVLYHRPYIDITDAVIARYEERFGDKPLDLKLDPLPEAKPSQAGGDLQ